jgi:integrase/recombinase XerD
MLPKNRFGSKAPPSGDLPDHRVEYFIGTLRRIGYVSESLRTKRRITSAFVLWAGRRGLSVDECDENHVVAFLRRAGIRSKDRVPDERATVRLFLRHIRGEEGVHHTPLRFDPARVEDLERQYLDHLRHERGLAKNSILVYMLYVRDFLSAIRSRRGALATREIDAGRIQAFMLGRLRGRSSEWSRLLSVALRSFLRFLYVRGKTSIDLSRSVPTVQRWRQASVPQYLAPQQVAQVLSATPRSTLKGRRDYAILLLLARLGLRAGEIVLMELGDIRWRSGDIVVRGKGGMRDRLPLLPDVGRALAAYLRKGRPRVASRRVFLRSIPPRVGLMGPAAVGHVARAALARAGIRRTSRGAAHIFRHSLATEMIRSGASLPEISEVLRHRSQDTTAIYAKVDFEALRSVARPWLRSGGAK